MDVRFDPKATKLARRRNMPRRADFVAKVGCTDGCLSAIP
jgi:hypothetical protein